MIFLGIGSNLSSSFGDRFKNIDLSISLLESYQINIIKKSSFYETPSFPDKTKPKFIRLDRKAESNLLEKLSLTEIKNGFRFLKQVKSKKKSLCIIEVEI